MNAVYQNITTVILEPNELENESIRVLCKPAWKDWAHDEERAKTCYANATLCKWYHLYQCKQYYVKDIIYINACNVM